MTASSAPAAPAGVARDPVPRRPARRPLGAYQDPDGRRREIVARPGAYGSVLVIDEDARTLGDRRLVAHLPCDEPAANARLVCELYLPDPHPPPPPVAAADWPPPPGAGDPPPPPGGR